MLNVNIQETTYKIRNQIDELTIGEFETISGIMNNTDMNNIEKWTEVFAFLGIPKDVIESFDSFAMIEIIKEFTIFDNKLEMNYQTELTLNGEVYYASFNNGVPSITVKEIRLIEDHIVKNPHKYLSYMLAVIYKRKDLDKNITYDKSHISFKMDLIRKNVKADVAMPYVKFIANKLVKDYEFITG